MSDTHRLSWLAKRKLVKKQKEIVEKCMLDYRVAYDEFLKKGIHPEVRLDPTIEILCREEELFDRLRLA